MLLAASVGVWLFYVQHQFEHTIWANDGDWNLHDAALHGSSHYDLPAFLRWFTANIGVHHVHHLSSRIPYYRLPRVLRDHPELRARRPADAAAELPLRAPRAVGRDAAPPDIVPRAADGGLNQPQKTTCLKRLSRMLRDRGQESLHAGPAPDRLPGLLAVVAQRLLPAHAEAGFDAPRACPAVPLAGGGLPTPSHPADWSARIADCCRRSRPPARRCTGRAMSPVRKAADRCRGCGQDLPRRDGRGPAPPQRCKRVPWERHWAVRSPKVRFRARRFD